jgi:hypothetical protein
MAAAVHWALSHSERVRGREFVCGWLAFVLGRAFPVSFHSTMAQQATDHDPDSVMAMELRFATMMALWLATYVCNIVDMAMALNWSMTHFLVAQEEFHCN